MPSSAHATFETRILEVRRLLSLCTAGDADWQIKKERANQDGAILRGALVLLCSHIEGYFEDLICDLVEAYDKLADDVRKLPVDLCARQVLGSPKLWDQKDPRKRWETVQGWASHQLLKIGVPKPSGILDSDLHTHGFGNPGTSEIKDLFKTVGFEDIWEQFHAVEADQLYKSSVDIIVNRRNQIAHGKLDATVTLDDVELYVQRAERVATVFDQLISSELNNRLGLTDCWNVLEAKKMGTAMVPGPVGG